MINSKEGFNMSDRKTVEYPPEVTALVLNLVRVMEEHPDSKVREVAKELIEEWDRTRPSY